MIFGKRRFTEVTQLPPLTLANEVIQYVDQYKYLGVNLDQNLNFNAHLKSVHKVVTHLINTLTAINPYKTKILPYFDYGDIFYHNTNLQMIEKLKKLENRALRICLGSPYRTPRKILHYSTKVPLLVYRRLVHLRNFMFTRKRKINFIDTTYTRTRAHDAVKVKEIKSNFATFDRNVLSKGSKEWNSLDPGTIEAFQL